jgi:hypothetical protein
MPDFTAALADAREREADLRDLEREIAQQRAAQAPSWDRDDPPTYWLDEPDECE